MRMPPADSSPETLHVEYGLYHLARLRADKNQKDLADAFEKVQGRLKTAMDALSQAHDFAVTTAAIRDGEDDGLDEAVRALANAILGTVNNNRKSPLFVKYFPDGMSPVVVAPLEAEMQKVGVILGLLAQEQNQAIASHAAPLRAALDRLTAAMSTHKAAINSEVQLNGVVLAEVLNWLDAYKLSHRTLAQRFYSNPQKAEGFFRPAPKRRKKGGESQPTAKAG